MTMVLMHRVHSLTGAWSTEVTPQPPPEPHTKSLLELCLTSRLTTIVQSHRTRSDEF